MREELATLRHWHGDGAVVAIASVIATSQSAPRQPGSVLCLHPDGSVLGSVSGGCVEGAVVEVATQVLETKVPQQVRYAISDDEAFSVGLTCGGTIEVFVRAVSPGDLDLAALADRIDDDEPLAVVTLIEHALEPGLAGQHMTVTPHGLEGSTGDAHLDRDIRRRARVILDRGQTGIAEVALHGERNHDAARVFVQSFVPRPHMLVFGAMDFAGALTSIGCYLGYRVTVCDARARFATAARFPDADDVVVAWPHRYLRETVVDHRTVICVLTHDPKFDVPVLQVALESPAAYVGVLGSRSTHQRRLERLRQAGVSHSSLDRLRSPIGLDLGGRTPQETAVSIAAEIIACRHGGSGRSLRETAGAIHRTEASAPT